MLRVVLAASGLNDSMSSGLCVGLCCLGLTSRLCWRENGGGACPHPTTQPTTQLQPTTQPPITDYHPSHAPPEHHPNTTRTPPKHHPDTTQTPKHHPNMPPHGHVFFFVYCTCGGEHWLIDLGLFFRVCFGGWNIPSCHAWHLTSSYLFFYDAQLTKIQTIFNPSSILLHAASRIILLGETNLCACTASMQAHSLHAATVLYSSATARNAWGRNHYNMEIGIYKYKNTPIPRVYCN